MKIPCLIRLNSNTEINCPAYIIAIPAGFNTPDCDPYAIVVLKSFNQGEIRKVKLVDIKVMSAFFQDSDRHPIENIRDY